MRRRAPAVILIGVLAVVLLIGASSTLHELTVAASGLPLPLGGNVVRRDLGPDTVRRISRLLKESIRYALDHRQDALTYALRYARDMDRSLADQFVGMYVNDWTLDYGPRGAEAVRRLLDEGHKAGVIPNPVAVEFVE